MIQQRELALLCGCLELHTIQVTKRMDYLINERTVQLTILVEEADSYG